MKMIIKSIKDSIDEYIKKYNLPETIDLEYDEIEIVINPTNNPQLDKDYTVKDYTYTVKTKKLIDGCLADLVVDQLPEEIAKQYDENYFSNYSKSENILYDYLGEHFNELLEKNMKDILEYYEHEVRTELERYGEFNEDWYE